LLQRIEHALLPMPIWHAQPLPHDESRRHVHALTSLIEFDDHTVTKTYAPGLIPRLLYWLAFQAPFPYMGNRDALEAALHRRNLAGMLTEYWYGQNRVAPAIRVAARNGRLGIVSALVDGTEPVHLDAARRFLYDVADHFDEAGLPSWQIDPRQPRSLGNLIERPDGDFTIIDLESGIVSPLASPRSWLRAIRRGSVPLFDEVYFDLTRRYVSREEPKMRVLLGDAWVTRLHEKLDAAETAEQRWHCGEPRIWRRLLRTFWTAIGRDVPPSPCAVIESHRRDA
jgi:hypothetical protein